MKIIMKGHMGDWIHHGNTWYHKVVLNGKTYVDGKEIKPVVKDWSCSCLNANEVNRLFLLGL